ncbi:MAG: hypothetical protein AAF666_02755 [Pseudomonadota bacterium]
MRIGLLVALFLFLGTVNAGETESTAATDGECADLGKDLDAIGQLIETIPSSPRLIAIYCERAGIDPERPAMTVEHLGDAECGEGDRGWRFVIGDFLCFCDPHFVEAKAACSVRMPGGKAVPDVQNQITKTRRTYRHIPVRHEIDFCGSIEDPHVGRAELSVQYTGPDWS